MGHGFSFLPAEALWGVGGLFCEGVWYPTGIVYITKVPCVLGGMSNFSYFRRFLMKTQFFRALSLGGALAAVCVSHQAFSAEAKSSATSPLTTNTPTVKTAAQAKAVLLPLGKSDVKGVVTFTQTANGVKVVVDASGLTPSGEHGFHIHEFGDCSSPDGMSTGGHFNPTHMPHGGPDSAQHHEGDFGNLIANKEGNAHYELVVKDLSFDGPNSFMGRAVIIHAAKDDLTSQPAGNAGARVTCGVIGVVKAVPL
jgi:Cu-Zn family superoxide dismutase